MTQEEFDVLKQIKIIVDWYNGKDEKGYLEIDIERLLYTSDKLATYTYYLTELVAQYKKNYNDSYFIRKIGIAREKNNLIKAGSKIGSADSESILTKENIDSFQKELNDEYIAVKCEGLLQSVYTIITSIGRRIKHLESEKILSNKQL